MKTKWKNIYLSVQHHLILNVGVRWTSSSPISTEEKKLKITLTQKSLAKKWEKKKRKEMGKPYEEEIAWLDELISHIE